MFESLLMTKKKVSLQMLTSLFSVMDMSLIVYFTGTAVFCGFCLSFAME